MAKKKSSLIHIEKISDRHATYKKRKGCLLKKTEELSVLCGVQACIVMYGPDNPDPDIWPPRPQEETLSILTHFNNLPEAVRNKNTMNQKDFVSKQADKLRVELRRVEEENLRLEAMVLLHEVLAGQSTIADVAGSGTGGMLMLSGAVEARLNEVRERMNEMCSVSVPQPVGPLEEVLLQGQCSFRVSGTADAASQGQKRYFSGFDCSDVAPPRKKQRVFGLGNADVASGLGEQFCLPNRYPLVVVGNREGGCGPESSDVAPPGKKQWVFGLGNADMAPCLGEQFGVSNFNPQVGNRNEGCGPESSDMAPPPGKNQRVFGLGNADVVPRLDDQFCLPNWYPLAGNREGVCGPDSSDVAPPGKKQCVFGLGNSDLAPCQGGQLYLPDCDPVVDSREEECGPKSADVEPPGKSQCMLGPVNTDIMPQMGEQFEFNLPDWCPAGDSREGGYVPESADMAAVPWSPDAEDEIDQFFDWSSSGLQEFLSAIY